MNRPLIFYVMIFLYAYISCSGVAEKDMPHNIKKSHKITITGTVGHVERLDVDKTGKHQKFILHFSLKVDSYDDSAGWTLIGSVIKCVIKEKTVTAQTGRTLQSGDRIIITANIFDVHPEVIAVHKLQFIDR